MAKKKAVVKTVKQELEQETMVNLDAPEAPDQQDTEQAMQVLRAEQEGRRQRCGQRIQAILTEEGCKIDPSFTITTQGIVPRVDIVPVR